MALSVGDKLGPYEILALIGAGGMGEVYKARDTRLDRVVAVKVSKTEFSERFEREARAVAAVNHSYICTLHDVGPNYLVMEYIEGAPLKGPLPVDQTLRYAVQICDALDAAHKKGIIHRDLKPANILVTKAGIKLLDFGLAKMLPPPAAGDATRTMALTGQGQILGTLFYMSPEQLQGQEADARSDIFSFGLVLCELFTGKRAFEGSSPVSVIAAILERPAPSIADCASPALDRLLKRCLEKDPDSRWQTVRDLKAELEWIASVPEIGSTVTAAPVKKSRRDWVAWAVAASAIMCALFVSFVHYREKPPSPTTPFHLQMAVPENATLLLNVSPDGHKVAFIAGDRLWVQSLESGESHDLALSEGSVPFWSPDSRFIGYQSEGKLKKIDAAGGPPQTVADAPGPWGGGSWNQDDVIVFGNRPVGFFRVSAAGGAPTQITAPDPARQEKSQYCPSFLPDGRHFVYIRASTDETKSAIYLGSVDATPERQSPQPLVASHWQPGYAPSADPDTGYLLFMRDGTLMAQPFDNRRLALRGHPTPVAEQVADNGGGGGAYAGFSVSNNGVLVFQQRVASDQQLTWYDRDGKVLGTTGEPGEYDGLVLPTNGRWVAVEKAKAADAVSIWLLDLSRGGASTRFTFGSASERYAVWSPDGRRIIFSSNRGGPFNLYEKPVDSSEGEVVRLKSSEDKFATSWSRDGRFLLYTVVDPKTKDDVWVLPLNSNENPVPFLVTEFSETEARFSPDGHWVAYSSDESGRFEVYVRSFSMNSAGTAVELGGKWPISNGGGREPRWRGDGHELYYQSVTDSRLMAVKIATHPAFRAEAPEPLGVVTLRESVWDSAADGKRFLKLAAKTARPEPYMVVLNWQTGLKK
jgi:serine/threonine protein kinase